VEREAPEARNRFEPAADGDEELVAAAVSDRRAFAPLYRRYVDPVHRYCYRRLGTREAAEDATSLVFAKALAALPGYRSGPGCSFRAWLFTIAHHVVADAHRSARAVAPLEEAGEVVDASPRPEEAVLAAEAARSLRGLLGRLPPAERRVIELRLAGLTGREIAEVLGKNQNAVDVAQFRAIRRLRGLLGVEAKVEEASRGGR